MEVAEFLFECEIDPIALLVAFCDFENVFENSQWMGRGRRLDPEFGAGGAMGSQGHFGVFGKSWRRRLCFSDGRRVGGVGRVVGIGDGPRLVGIDFFAGGEGESAETGLVGMDFHHDNLVGILVFRRGSE